MAVMIDRVTGEAAPLTSFLRAEQFARDVAEVNDAARGPFLSAAGMALAMVRNYDPFRTPSQFIILDLMKKFGKKLLNHAVRPPATRKDDVNQGRAERWHLLFVAGMWFQDLFNYDFRRTEMCIIPYATQQGEISFCAYNTGIGWRHIVEKMHRTATLSQWHAERGRHDIFAAGKSVPLDSVAHSLVIDEEAADQEAQPDLDRSGVPKNARQEGTKRRVGQPAVTRRES
jgi:uncharacterized radical SAM superfamily Fe-S cluster-containing enzyme